MGDTEHNRASDPPMDRSRLADAILSSALDCIIVSDAQGRIVEFNAMAERTFGFTRAQVLGRTMEETIVPAHHRDAHRRGMDRYLKGGKPVVVGRRVEVEALHADGHTFPVELSITDAQMEDRHYFVANLRDITVQKQTASDLKRAQASLEAIFNNIPAALYLRDRQDHLVMINNWGANFLGRKPEEMIGQDMARFREPQNTQGVRESDAAIIRDRKPVTRPFTYHLPGGDRIGLMTFFPVEDEHGEVIQIGGMMMDATELYEARNDLQQARNLLQSIFDNVPAVLYLREIDGRIVTVNKWGAAVMGADDPAKIIGASVRGFDSDEQRVSAEEAQDRLLETGQPVTMEYRLHLDGQDRVVLNSIFPVRDGEGNITRIGGFASDVTELYAARNELQEAKALLQTIFDNVPAELYLRRLDGQYLMANKWALEFYGYTEADLPSLTAETFDTGDEVAKSRQAQRELLETGRPVTREYHHKVKGRDAVILNTIFPLRNASGEIDRIGGVSTDITELSNARLALRQAQDNLHQNEKLAALGQLLAGVAHELNNPLAVVLGRAAILQEKLAGTPHEPPLQKLREAANRCARIVKTFLAMARQTGPRRALTDVDEMVEAALEMTTYSLRKANVVWNVTRLEDALKIEVDEDQIVQVLINLILNAQHALEAVEGDRRLDIQAFLCPSGEWVHLTIADNGPGVPDDISTRIFDPFFTTKAVGQGTGLGLSVCKSMVEAHGGKLVHFKTDGGGASFRISLPVGGKAAASDGDEDGTAGQSHIIGRILIVDDEIEIAAILADCLTPLGIDCVIATDGQSALGRLAEASFDGIFCDVSMPGMDGITFYNALKETNPLLARHLIFISGDVLHREWDRLKASVDRPVIEKPFDPRHVRDAALSLLGKEGGPG